MIPATRKRISHQYVSWFHGTRAGIVDATWLPLLVGHWQFKFASECVADVAARTLTAEAPSYATIMELDKKVREFPLPEDSLTSPSDFSSTFQKCVLEHIRETST